MRKYLSSLLSAVGILLITAFPCVAAQTKTLWQIGACDGKNSEFALAPKGYHYFAEDGFFIVGQSSPMTDWPYVQPGPSDDWAGSRPHTFCVLFGLGKTAATGTCRLVINALDTHYSSPPVLQIDINEQSFERRLPAGASDASIFGNPTAGKPTQVTVEFSAALLREGNNQIRLTSKSGSWFLYDCVALETASDIEGGVLQETTVMLSARVLPGIIERAGKKFQSISVSVARAGGPKEAAVQVGGQPAQTVQLRDGRQTVDVLVPAVDKITPTTCTLAIGGRKLATQSLTLAPGLREIVVVFKTHFDIG